MDEREYERRQRQGSEDWYTPKELYEMIQDLKKEFFEEVPTLRAELNNTVQEIRKYNALRRDLVKVMERLSIIEQKRIAEHRLIDRFLRWGGWIVGLGSLAVALAQSFVE